MQSYAYMLDISRRRRQYAGRSSIVTQMANTTIQVRTKIAAFRVTADQYKLIDQRAKQCGVRLGVWMRFILLQAASRKPSEGYLRIR
jgi:hypothetical protein